MAKVPMRNVWDGEEFVPWPEDESPYCDGCGALIVSAPVVHGPGCDGTDPDAAVGRLMDELAELAAAGEAERGQVTAEALAELERAAGPC